RRAKRGVALPSNRSIFNFDQRASKGGPQVTQQAITARLDRPVDEANDHILGPLSAPITLVEYGSYACPYCRAVNEHIVKIRHEFGDRLCYVFRHLPLTGSEIALRAAELAEYAQDDQQFWDAHVTLMSRSHVLTEEDLARVADNLHLSDSEPDLMAAARSKAAQKVAADMASARASHAAVTPTFFINGRRYDGAWDESSFTDAMLRTPGHR